MKTTIIVDFDSGLAWILDEPEYRFNFEATQEALNILQKSRYDCSGEAGIGWQILYNAMAHLEKECANYFKVQK